MARSLQTYLLSLFVALVGCPQLSWSGQDPARSKIRPTAPVLPVEEAWNVSLPSPPSAAGALDGSRAFVPLRSGQLVALDRETGDDAWSIEISSAFQPVAGDGALFIAGGTELRAVHAESGETIWTRELDAEPLVAPLLQGTTIVLVLKPDSVRAFHASTGSELWRSGLGLQAAPRPIAADANSVCVAAGGRISRLGLADGQLHWTRELPGTLSPPTMKDGRVFVGSTENAFYALDAGTGRVMWHWRSGGDVVGAAADDRLVYVASLDNLLRAFRLGSGNQVWKRELTTRTTAPPATFGGVVLLSGNDPALSTFNAETGAPISTFVLPADLNGVPLVDRTLVPFKVAMVALTRDGRAIGLRPTGMMFHEPRTQPLQTLPGRALPREPLSLPTSQPPTPSSDK